MRRRRPADELERAVLQAALELLERDGYGGLSVEAVAERSRTAKTTIYRRWRDKADLVTAAMAAFAEPGPALPDDPREALVVLLEGFKERMDRKGMGVLSSVLVETRHPELLELHRARVIHPRRDQLHAQLRRAVAGGMLRADTDVQLAADLLVGSYFARHIAGEADLGEWASRAVDMLWEGLRPRG